MTTQHMPTLAEAFRELNRGTDWRTIGDAIGAEHGYLVNTFSLGWARGILRKCWPDKTCGDVMSLLANGPNFDVDSLEWAANRIDRRDHPYHDGELNCNVVRAAMLVLNVTGWSPANNHLALWTADQR